MTKIEELMNNEEFVEKVNKVESMEQAQELFAKEGVDINDEISLAEEEMSESELDNVAGGFITFGQAVKAWGAGCTIGVYIRNIWDMKHKKPLTYPHWRLEL